MDFKSLLITGGAGFVGANLATRFRREFPDLAVTALDNLKRRGSELNVSRLGDLGVRFVHGDVRSPEDFEGLADFDLLIDCAAEPSVQAGAGGSPRYVLNTNLLGTINCLEAARVRRAALLFLSTSRVYPIATLNDVPFLEEETRFRWNANGHVPGLSQEGVAETFPLDGPRSLYGASKLACELLVHEYVHTYGLRALIDRCGILTGPWQMGKVDQGVVTLWVARHYFGRPLRYLGFGGRGKQVRDLLHVDDLFDLLVRQMESAQTWRGDVYNVGGGVECSLSLLELTGLCRAVTGRRIEIDSAAETNPLDLRIYLSDTRKVQRDFGWRPQRGAERIVRDIHAWIDRHRDTLETILD